MKTFWAYISNAQYSVATTGRTVFLFDETGQEIARFKDIPYGYRPLFSPDGRLFVVKSTAGMLAVYSLESHSLIKKFRFSKAGYAQDDGFCFSPDGKWFINLEQQGDDLYSAISVYDTTDFSRVRQILLNEDMRINHMEYDDETQEYYVLGVDEESYFIAKYNDGEIVERQEVSYEKYDFYKTYLDLEMTGFTDKAYRWSYMEEPLEELKGMKMTLAKWYRLHKEGSPG